METIAKSGILQRLRWLCTYFACKTKAQMPAAKGALADVPVWDSVQPLRRSVVTCHLSILSGLHRQINPDTWMLLAHPSMTIL